MWLKLLEGVWNLIVLAIIINWVADWTSGPVKGVLRKKVNSLVGVWREVRLGAMARELVRLERIQRRPEIALADMLMAMFVAVVGGGYAIIIVVAASYARLAHGDARPDIVLVLGGCFLVLIGMQRAIGTQGQLLKTESKIRRLRTKALMRGWDLDDAVVGLKDD
jgi:hypothetical protein